MNQKIIDFYENKHSVGRNNLTFDQVTKLPDARLEQCHDYIQWLFPLPEQSRFMRDAPILDRETARRLSSGYSLRVSEAIQTMMRFWKIDLRLGEDGPATIKMGQYWMQPEDHNHFRISRVIRFLTLLAEDRAKPVLYSDCAERILEVMVKANEEKPFATDTTVKFWKKAAQAGWDDYRSYKGRLVVRQVNPADWPYPPEPEL